MSRRPHIPIGNRVCVPSDQDEEPTDVHEPREASDAEIDRWMDRMADRYDGIVESAKGRRR